MKLDYLPVDKQETATYCHSCGEVRGSEQLGLWGARLRPGWLFAALRLR